MQGNGAAASRRRLSGFRLVRTVLACILVLAGLAVGPVMALGQGKAPAGPGKPAPAVAYTATAVDGLPDEIVWTVAFDGQDRPWVGTGGGGGVLEQGSGWRWLAAEETGPRHGAVYAYLFEPDGRMWVGGEAGIDLFEGEQAVAHYTWDDGLAASSAQDLAFDAQGNVWAAHLAEGVSRFDGSEWAAFSTDDGLLDNWVYGMALDGDGALWFGTLEGVSRFDGVEWRSFTTADGLAGPWVSGVAAAPSGDLWFATDGGVSQFDGQAWTTHLAGRAARAVAVAEDGVVWAAGSGFVSFWDGSAWHDVQSAWFAGQLLLALALRPNGEVWVGSLGDGLTVLTPNRAGGVDGSPPGGEGAALWLGTPAGVSVLMGDEQVRFDVEDGLAGSDVRALLIDGAGRTWVGTTDGASMYDGAAWTTYRPSLRSISSNHVRRVAVDPQGRIWFAYGERGLGVSVKDGDAWQQFGAADGLGSERVYSMAFGLHGEVWLGTEAGVSQRNRTRWTNLAAQAGAPGGKIEALAVAPDGKLWAGFGGGVAVYDGRRWRSYGPDDGLTVGSVRAIAFDADGNVWVGAAPLPASAQNGGLFVYDSGVWSAIDMDRTQSAAAGPAAQPLGDWVNGLVIDARGNLWAGSYAHPLAKPLSVGGGVSVQTGDVLGDVGWTVYTTGSGLAGDKVTALAVDATGGLWAGTEQGLSRFNGETWTSFTTGDGLPDNHVTALAADAHGGLWVATAGGAAYYDGAGWSYTMAGGLADRTVRALAEDGDGAIWFATAGGVSRFDGVTWTAFTTLDGLAANDSRAVVVDGAGNVWVGGGADQFAGDGLSRFDGKGWTTWPLRGDVAYANVTALAVDPAGRPWAVACNPGQFTVSSALFAFDGAAWHAEPAPGPLVDDRVLAYVIGEDGRHWFGTDGSYNSPTLLAYDGEGWESARVAQTPAAVNAIVLDGRTGGWLGTALGLAYFGVEDGAVEVTLEDTRGKVAVQVVALGSGVPAAR